MSKKNINREGPSAQQTSPRTYVNNSFNRKHDRVGLQVRTAVVHKKDGNNRRYADNQQNRKVGRVGMEHGDAVIYKNSDTSFVPATQTKVYANNSKNRRLDRVGKQHGTAVYSANSKCVMKKTYVNSSMNRKAGRVGEPRGSLPLTKSKTTVKIPDMLEKLEKGDDVSTFRVYLEQKHLQN